MAVCSQCGSALKEGAKFCENCGAKAPGANFSAKDFDAEPTSAMPVPPSIHASEDVPAPEDTGVPAAPAPPAPSIGQGDFYGTAPAPAPKKKRSCLGCILGVLAVLIVLFLMAAAGGAWWYFKGGGAQLIAEKMGKIETLTPEQAPGEMPPANEPQAPEEPQPANELAPEISPEPTQPESPPVEPSPPPSQIIVDRPALRAAKEKAEVALDSFKQATDAAEKAGAARLARGEFDSLRETHRTLQANFSNAKSPGDYNAVTRSAQQGTSRALEMQSQAERAAAEQAAKAQAPPPSQPQPPPPPPPPPPKQPKASFGFIFETPVNGKKLVLKVDGEKLVEQDFEVSRGTYRFAKDFALPPGKHHIRAAVHQPDGKVIAQDWDFDFQLGTTPVFKVVLENSPRQMTMKRMQ